MTIRYNKCADCKFLTDIFSRENGVDVTCSGTPSIVCQPDCFTIDCGKTDVSSEQTGETEIEKFIKWLQTAK